MKLGLKLWSTNHLWFPEAVQRFQNKEFEFIELYAVPQSFNPSHLQILKEASIPINIHCSNEHLNNPLVNERLLCSRSQALSQKNEALAKSCFPLPRWPTVHHNVRFP